MLIKTRYIPMQDTPVVIVMIIEERQKTRPVPYTLINNVGARRAVPLQKT